MYSNIHTGKFIIEVNSDEDPDNPRVVLSLPEIASCIKGMQIYLPVARKISRKRVEEGHLDIFRFPRIVQEIMFPNSFLKDTLDYKSVLKEFTVLTDWLRRHRFSHQRELRNILNEHVRIELFMEYRGDDEVPDEKLENAPSFASCLRIVQTSSLKRYMEKKILNHLSP